MTSKQLHCFSRRLINMLLLLYLVFIFFLLSPLFRIFLLLLVGCDVWFCFLFTHFDADWQWNGCSKSQQALGRCFKITFWYTQETFVAFPPRCAVVLSFWFGSLCIDKATSGQFWPALFHSLQNTPRNSTLRLPMEAVVFGAAGPGVVCCWCWRCNDDDDPDATGGGGGGGLIRSHNFFT